MKPKKPMWEAAFEQWLRLSCLYAWVLCQNAVNRNHPLPPVIDGDGNVIQ